MAQLDLWRGSAGTGSATAPYFMLSDAAKQEIVDTGMKRMGYYVAPKTSLPSTAATSVPSVNSTASFTAGEQIGFAAQAINSILGNVAANRANKAQASALREQAGIYSLQSELSMRGAEMYAGQAAAAADIGKMNARNLSLAAAQLDYYEQLRLREATLEARQRIGHGRVGFAANGVLVDSGSAALWEQDEAADAALEKLDIMQQFEDQGWSYRTQANKAEAEGYAAAAAQAGQAAAAAGQAAAYQLQAESARAAAARAKKKKSWGATIGTVLGAGIGSVIPGVGTLAGAAAGAALGGALGGVYDASRG